MLLHHHGLLFFDLDSVHFTVTMAAADLDAIEKGDGLHKFFKLESSVTTSNMVLFDQDAQLTRRVLLTSGNTKQRHYVCNAARAVIVNKVNLRYRSRFASKTRVCWICGNRVNCDISRHESAVESKLLANVAAGVANCRTNILYDGYWSYNRRNFRRLDVDFNFLMFSRCFEHDEISSQIEIGDDACTFVFVL